MTPSPNTQTASSSTGFLGAVIAWFEHPFQSSGSALNWLLFVGLLIAVIWFWQVVLLEITREL
jgi:hypothetical protein